MNLNLNQAMNALDIPTGEQPIYAARIHKYRPEGEMTYNVCKAFEDMKLEGIEQGILLAIQNLMESMQFSVEQAMEALKIPAEKQAGYLEQIRK